MKAFLWLGMAGVSLLVLAGCATPSQPAMPLTGDALIDGHNRIEHGPAKDRVLWQYRTALVAMRRGQYDEAKRLLDDAILSMGGIVVGDKSARQARGYFSQEAKKTFIGEPYERVMAFFYRGILYWMDGEPDNARACFRSAQFHDSDTEDREYSADYVLLEYLDGYATAKLAGDGSDAFKRAQALSQAAVLPPYDREANVLVFLEFGSGPAKYATGEYGEQLRFRTGKTTVHRATVKAGTQVLAARAYDDLFFQATTRGGRVMDHVLANKAVFKAATDTAGDVAIISGVVLAHNRKTQEAGLGLAAAGLLSKIISAATTPAADTRAWDNLPQFLSFVALRLPPGQHALTVEFHDAQGHVKPGLTKTVTVNVEPAKDRVVFVSEKSSIPKSL